jgi:nucleoside diphosphate kinase
LVRPFFNGLVKYMDQGPVVAMCWEGENAVKTGKKGLEVFRIQDPDLHQTRKSDPDRHQNVADP